ncbi:hypothetical protein [uncultured Gammaproteobacteria bacterium]|nr:hypothetical protein [uncultured Gammaproteobacteria bacterium]CAC9479240.1 hypothetical protein [uncultured Gammaproteobacteria bacterium]
MVDLLTPILSAMINRVSLLLGKMFVLVHLYSFTRPKKSK